jgi:UDP-N-acetylglucosamine 2-epimerase (non-hydrolysing)
MKGSSSPRFLHVVGARPNFPKLAPVYRAAISAGVRQLIVHTGQHYDDSLSAGFFRTLGIPKPDVNLAVGSGSHAVQTARIMERLEPVLASEQPDWVVVYGDVNSTLAAAVVAAKLGIRVAHVEAGLRSRDLSMPEEINRIVTDRLSNLLLTPSRDAGEILRSEGEPEEEIVFVGNVMVDSLLYGLEAARGTEFHRQIGVGGQSPVVVTLHRPSNVDDPSRLGLLIAMLREISTQRPVVFPAHPRTQQRVAAEGIDVADIRLLDPVGYLEMIDLVANAHAVVTDSGGLQEETTVLGIPCFTVRENTERPVTITEGTNRLVRDLYELPGLVRAAKRPSVAKRPDGWDGRAGERIISALMRHSLDRVAVADTFAHVRGKANTLDGVDNAARPPVADVGVRA